MTAQSFNAPDAATALANIGDLARTIILLMNEGGSTEMVCAVAGAIVDTASAAAFGAQLPFESD